MVDLGRDFWIRETGTGQQVDQLHDRYMVTKYNVLSLNPYLKCGLTSVSIFLSTLDLDL